MLRRRALAVAGVVVCALASVLLCTGATAATSRTEADHGRPSTEEAGRPSRGEDVPAPGHPERHTGLAEGAPPVTTLPGTAPDSGGTGDVGTESVVTETVTGGTTVGGAPATSSGAAETEALVAPTAPTPPNGAETAAAGSPGAAVPSEEGQVAAGSSPSPEAAALPGAVGAAVGATDPLPVAGGLSPDTTGSGVIVAILAFVVLLFLVAHQFVDRRDPRLYAAHDAEAVARFR